MVRHPRSRVTRLAVLGLFVSCCGLTSAATVAAQESPLGSPRPLGLVGPRAEHFIDDTASLGPDEVLRRDAFVPSAEAHPNFGFTSAVIWVRFSIHNPGDAPRRYVLDATREWVDEVDLYRVEGADVRLLHRSGTRVSFDRRPVPSTRVAFPIALEGGERATYLLRLRSRSPISLHGVVLTERGFQETVALDHLAFGAFGAMLFGLAAYNLLLFAFLRSRSQLLIASFVLSYVSAEALSHGYLSWLLGSRGGWLELGGGALGFAIFVFLLLRLALERRGGDSPPLVLRASPYWVSLPALIAAALPRLYVLVFVTIGLAIPMTIALVARRARGDRRVKLFLFAVSALLVPGTATLMVLVGLLPAYPLIEYANHLGAVVMSVLFSTLVADAIQSGQRSVLRLSEETSALNEELEARLIEVEAAVGEARAANEELRFQVAARSRALTDVLAQHEGPVQAEPHEVGDVIDGRYRLEGLLGEGGWGLVYQARRLSDQGVFALKLLTRALSGPQAARLAREAEIGAKVHHPNLIGIVDVGMLAGGAPYLVMELVRGGSLESLRERFGDAGLFLPILRDACRGLAALHAQQVVHRDVKPGNVLLDVRDGGLVGRLSDFGIALPLADVDPLAPTPPGADRDRLTRAGALLGTPAYLPPEAAHGEEPVGEKADVFAFGTMAYEALTGACPYDGVPVYLVMAGRALPEPEPLVCEHEGIDEPLLRCLERAVRADPAERPSAEELAAAFAGVEGPPSWGDRIPTTEDSHLSALAVAPSPIKALPRILGDRYEVLARVGAGGMATVVRAKDKETGLPVAIKLLHRTDAPRIERELAALRALTHEAVVRYVSHGAREDGSAFLVMEWLEGRDLAQRLLDSPLSVAEVILLARRLAEGLRAIHSAGLVHRDIKPANVVLVGDEVGAAKIVDLGLARRIHAATLLTRSGAVIGTAGYLAPEQVLGRRELTAAADLFALGCVLYEALTGTAAFTGTTSTAVLLAILHETPAPLRERCPDCPAELEALIEALLRKDPAERPASAGEVLSCVSGLVAER